MPGVSRVGDLVFVRKVIALWQSGLSTSQMGRELGMTKNAVVGLCGRNKDKWGLTERASPIRREYGPPRPPVAPSIKPAPKHTLPRANHAAPPAVVVEPLDKDDWLRWFNRQSDDQRRAMAKFKHPRGCAARAARGMWRCTCGATQPKPIQLQDPVTPPPVIAQGDLEPYPITEPPPPMPPFSPEPFDPDDPRDDPDDPDQEPEPEWDDGDLDGDLDEDDILCRPVSRDVDPHPQFDRFTECCYPKGTQAGRTLFCNAKVTTSRSAYCEDCRKLMYRKDESKDPNAGEQLSGIGLGFGTAGRW